MISFTNNVFYLNIIVPIIYSEEVMCVFACLWMTEGVDVVFECSVYHAVKITFMKKATIENVMHLCMLLLFLCKLL